MGVEARAAEVHAIALLVAEAAAKGIGVWALEGDAGFPEGCLGGADGFGSSVIWRVVACLGDHLGRIPADGLAGVVDDVSNVFGIEFAIEGSCWVGLIGVAFALVPKDRAEAIWA